MAQPHILSAGLGMLRGQLAEGVWVCVDSGVRGTVSSRHVGIMQLMILRLVRCHIDMSQGIVMPSIEQGGKTCQYCLRSGVMWGF